FFYEALRYFRSCPVELMRAVRSLAEQHKPSIADAAHQRIVIMLRAGQRHCSRSDQVEGVFLDSHNSSRVPNQVANLLVSGLPEIDIRAAYRMKRLRSHGTDDIVRNFSQLLTCFNR